MLSNIDISHQNSSELDEGKITKEDFRIMKLLSKRASAINNSPLRNITELSTIKGMVAISIGNPSPLAVPISEVEIKLKDGSKQLKIEGEEASSTFQYSRTSGNPELIKIFMDLQKKMHLISDEHYSIVIGNGAQNLLYMTFDLLLNEGDSVLVENPTYPGALAALNVFQPEVIGINMDEDGIIISELENILANWPSNKTKPKLFYTVPTGGNPSGVLTTTERKKQIYKIMAQNDIMIVEDDAYYFINFSGAYITSYLSIDTEKVVIRLDSMSKLISPGLRIGYLTAPNIFISKIKNLMEVSLVHTSNVSQAIVLKILSNWGTEGLMRHVEKISKIYNDKSTILSDILEKYLSGLAIWTKPKSGMFIWLRINSNIDSSIVYNKCLEKNVLVCKGEDFYYANKRPRSNCLRLSYSCFDISKLDESIKILHDVILEVQSMSK